MTTRIGSFFASARVVSSGARAYETLQVRDAAATALSMVTGVVRTATLCTALAWLATFLCSRGYFVVPAREQSYTAFVAAAFAWTHVLLSVVTLVTLALVLQSHRFVDAPDRAPTLWFCFIKLVKRTYVVFVSSLALMVALVYVLSTGPATVRAFKLEFYLNCLISHLFTTYADLVTRCIGHEETVRGQEATRAKLQQARSEQAASNLIRVPRRHRPRSNCAIYWRHYAQTSPMTLFVIVAGGFVHAMSLVNRTHAQRHFVLFTVGSTAFKVCMQEVAKWLALKRAVQDIRILCVAIGIPTVLIDTQVRMVLQSIQSDHASLLGTGIMTAVEILLRLAKVWAVRLEVRRLHTTSLNAVAPLSPPLNGHAMPSASTSETVARKERKILAFHSAESYADMSAEYIAIGCSASILFFSAHPKYALLSSAKTAHHSPFTTNSTTTGSSSDEVQPHLSQAIVLNQITTSLVQVAIEIVVDWTSSMLEISASVDFTDLLKHRSFIASFFLTLAVVNIEISAVIYAVWT